ncbi:hypothetical protein T265_02461 [Opisthorchis viverrini]|uniref:Uncharacterized protein n=1 Tax=Opisthorchis viverrini TaxID=6198 RepID=A0A074ZUY9_OPIVI|nr:hypothetical protein T265_02461 [Opisthorchis viverrini]KER31278.1 hypothetical protein T265_02461 [Opisthorchis viverrini]
MRHCTLSLIEPYERDPRLASVDVNSFGSELIVTMRKNCEPPVRTGFNICVSNASLKAGSLRFRSAVKTRDKLSKDWFTPVLFLIVFGVFLLAGIDAILGEFASDPVAFGNLYLKVPCKVCGKPPIFLPEDTDKENALLCFPFTNDDIILTSPRNLT